MSGASAIAKGAEVGGAETPLIDLAAAALGGCALLANDEFFAPKENLLTPGRGVFVEGKYTDRGKWMDGWETRRRRGPGHDWCLIRLGLPGRLRAVVIDTNHFRGNHPESAALYACQAPADADPAVLAADASAWREVVPRSPLAGHAENRFAPCADCGRVTHVRLDIFPDGGVARLRLLGEVVPDWPRLLRAEAPCDLAAVAHGGVPLQASDAFFSRPFNLLMPGRGVDMGDGWETRRRRGPGHDWVVLRLGTRGVIETVVVDTAHFKGNYPDRCALEGCDAPGVRGVPDDGREWFEILPETPLSADAEHRFEELTSHRPATHARLSIFPDGGVSRLRLFGRPLEAPA